MHHLSEEQFLAARTDIYEGLKGTYAPYLAAGRTGRGLHQLDIPLDDRPSTFFYSTIDMTCTEIMVRFGEAIEEIKEAQTPAQLLEQLRVLHRLYDEYTKAKEEPAGNV